MKVKDIAAALQEYAPLYLQESFDNSGLQVGDPEAEVTGVLLCTDVTEDIVDEAIAIGANMVVSHHPVLFHALRNIVGRTQVERVVMRALRHGVAIYSAHTSMDSAWGGVSFKMAEKLGLRDVRVLSPMRGKVCKIAVYVPTASADTVEQAMWAAGAGRQGMYDSCSYRLQGEGRYRALDGANPAMGDIGEHHVEPETRVEVLCRTDLKDAVLQAMLSVHPYEEPAYDVLPIENEVQCGLGVVGDCDPVSARDVLQQVKDVFGTHTVRYSGDIERTVTRVAMCGGAGAEFTPDAIAAGAQLFISADFRYHEFMGHEADIVLADIGHYESEHFTNEIFYDIISKKNPKFAVSFAKKERNQINFF